MPESIIENAYISWNPITVTSDENKRQELTESLFMGALMIIQDEYKLQEYRGRPDGDKW